MFRSGLIAIDLQKPLRCLVTVVRKTCRRAAPSPPPAPPHIHELDTHSAGVPPRIRPEMNAAPHGETDARPPPGTTGLPRQPGMG